MEKGALKIISLARYDSFALRDDTREEQKYFFYI